MSAFTRARALPHEAAYRRHARRSGGVVCPERHGNGRADLTGYDPLPWPSGTCPGCGAAV